MWVWHVCVRCCRLRREHQVPGGIPVLLSTEKPRCQLVSMVDLDGANPLDYQVLPCPWRGACRDQPNQSLPLGGCGSLPRYMRSTNNTYVAGGF